MKQHFIIITAAVLITACGTKQQPQETNRSTTGDTLSGMVVSLTAAQLQTIGLKTGRALSSNLHTDLRVNGLAEVPPEYKHSISFPMSGYLRTNKLIPGTRVHKGMLMATLEDAQYIQLQQDYLTGRSKLAYTEADFKRQEALNQTQSTSDKVFQLARAEYESQKIQVRALSEKLRLIGINPAGLSEQTISRTVNIYAPISGYVSQVNVNPGKYILPTDVLFELTDPSRLHLSLQVYEKDAAGLQAGQKVSCYTNAAPDQKMEATVHLINRSIGDNRAVEVHCDFDRHYKDLMPGTFLNATIAQSASKGNALPEDAVVRWQNRQYIFVMESRNRFVMQPVETGRSANGQIEITSALPDRDIVLVNAYALLMMLKNSSEES